MNLVSGVEVASLHEEVRPGGQEPRGVLPSLEVLAVTVRGMLPLVAEEGPLEAAEGSVPLVGHLGRCEFALRCA